MHGRLTQPTPHAPRATHSADAAACATLLRGGSLSFHAAARLLPGEVRRGATALYAFCRVADDAIDTAAPHAREAALENLTARLDAIYAGIPGPAPADRAFAALVARTPIPKTLPQALLEGFAWDAEGRRYETIESLHEYGARVAGTVGAMMAVVMGARAPDVVARACELGLAMQLTNIARDVGEDARAGRLYLPLAWLRAEGIDPDAFLANPTYSPGIGRIVARLLAEADRLYAQATFGIAHLPAACRPAIHAARLLYAAIGHKAGAPGFDPVAERAVVPTGQKLRLVARALAACAASAASISIAAPEAVRALVAEAALPAPMPRRRRQMPWVRVENKAIWVLDLFATLEARQRVGHVP
jgi:phytoene synthase